MVNAQRKAADLKTGIRRAFMSTLFVSGLRIGLRTGFGIPAGSKTKSAVWRMHLTILTVRGLAAEFGWPGGGEFPFERRALSG
jgi:hypothetical protein